MQVMLLEKQDKMWYNRLSSKWRDIMKIVIIGDGKVGRTITEHLAKEGHDVVVIDNNPKVIEECVNTFDVKGICGNGASYNVQKEAGVAGAGLLIAVTSSDELNILCCLVAKKMGVGQTIARVRNPDYSSQMYIMRDELGLSMIVNPELDAAREISRILRFPSAIKLDSFANGKVDLVEIKIDEKSPLVGKSLYSIHGKYQIHVLVCAVCRGDEVYIPKGDFILQANDKIYMTSSPAEITDFFKKLQILKEKSRNVMIIGGGKIAYYLASQLSDSGISFKIIESDYKRCLELSEAFHKAMIIHGDGTDQNVILEEGLENADALVTLTGLDEENIIISMFAKARGVSKIITKVNRSSYGSILDTVGLESIISPRDITTNHIIRHVRGMQNTRGSEFRTLYRLIGNRVEALEFYISTETDYTGVPLKSLPLKDNVLLACIIRNNSLIIPSGNDIIKPCDTVIIITLTQQIKDVSDILK